MRMCQNHWTLLQEAIKTRGLWHLVSETGEAAVDRLKKEIEGTATSRDYDPLMDLNNMISSWALKCGGLYLLSAVEICPLCEANKNKVNIDEIINGASDAILKYCTEHNLLG